jgi:Spy/CpxP family protein refolding chaperone
MMITLLATLLAATALAPKSDAPDRPDRERGRRGDKMCQMLDCTEAQKSEMKKIHAELRTDVADERAEMKRLRAAFVAEKQKENPDEQMLAKLRLGMERNRKAMHTELDEAKEATRAVLDEQQEEKLEKAFAERGKGHGKAHGKGHGKAHGKGHAKGHGKGKAHGHEPGKAEKNADKAERKADKRGRKSK